MGCRSATRSPHSSGRITSSGCSRLQLCAANAGRTDPRKAIKAALVETTSPHPPSSATRNQHVVVHHVDTRCACTTYWTYTVRTGVEPFRAVHARPVGLAPPQGCARLSCFRLPTRLSQEDQSSNQLPGYVYPTGEVPLQGRPPCVELPQRSPY